LIVHEGQGLIRGHGRSNLVGQVVEEPGGDEVLVGLINLKHSSGDLVVVLLRARLLGQILILLLCVLVSLEWHSVVIGPSHVVTELDPSDALLLHHGVDVVIITFEGLVKVSRDSSHLAGNLVFVQLTVGFGC